jgi:hypothetical protein
MGDNLEHRAAELAPQDQEENDLSRRAFLNRLTILGVGCAAVMTLGVGEADAAIKAKNPANDETMAESKKAELVEGVDPDDPLQQFAQLTPGERRRVRRRTRRTARRVRRRYRRTRRRVRRRVRRAVEFIASWVVAA